MSGRVQAFRLRSSSCIPPFLGLLLIVLAVITAVLVLTLWLPDAVFGR
jgi:mannitol-specific phosphotransferase system IIBC component